MKNLLQIKLPVAMTDQWIKGLFAEFMHIYFWVFISGFAFCWIYNYAHEEKLKGEKITRAGMSLMGLAAIVLFIMSFKY